MKLEIDADNDVAYLYLRHPVEYGESVRQTAIEGRPEGGLVVDWDINGAIIGFEFIGARALLGPAFEKGETA